MKRAVFNLDNGIIQSIKFDNIISDSNGFFFFKQNEQVCYCPNNIFFLIEEYKEATEEQKLEVRNMLKNN